jgi:hypothetical protein
MPFSSRPYSSYTGARRREGAIKTFAAIDFFLPLD